LSAVVEGIVDEAVVHRLVAHVGGEIQAIYGKNGKPFLRTKASSYNHAVRRAPWVLLVDLDDEQECAPLLRSTWLPAVAPHLCFRVAVRTVEAWLIADSERLAEFLHLAESRIPREPEALKDPKRTLVNLARSSRLRAVREDMTPRPDSGRLVGPAYTSRVIEFIQAPWRIDMASRRSESLSRAVDCIHRLVTSWSEQ